MRGQRRQSEPIGIRYSLLEGLPATYRGNGLGPGPAGFTPEFVRAFDDVLSTVHAALDDLDAYVDPQLAPDDFLAWLGGWLGVEVNERWPLQRRREFVRHIVTANRTRGTAEGIALAVELYTGVRPEVRDSGGVVTSTDPDQPLPGVPGRRVEVIIAGTGQGIDTGLIDQIVADAKPLHVEHVVRFSAQG